MYVTLHKCEQQQQEQKVLIGPTNDEEGVGVNSSKSSKSFLSRAATVICSILPVIDLNMSRPMQAVPSFIHCLLWRRFVSQCLRWNTVSGSPPRPAIAILSSVSSTQSICCRYYHFTWRFVVRFSSHALTQQHCMRLRRCYLSISRWTCPVGVVTSVLPNRPRFPLGMCVSNTFARSGEGSVRVPFGTDVAHPAYLTPLRLDAGFGGLDGDR